MRTEKIYNQKLAAQEAQLREIAELEEKHGILGIRFSTKEGAALTLENTSDYVIEAIKIAADLVERMDRGELPVKEPKQPK